MEDTERNQIIVEIWRDREKIFANISPTKLGEYNLTQTNLLKINVETDGGYQSAYDGFYRMAVRKSVKDWHSTYYKFLEREKRNSALTFETVLTKIFESLNRVEPSFSSKLVATVRPEMPVYDSVVLKNLSIDGPTPHHSRVDRLREAQTAYREIEQFLPRLCSRTLFAI